MSALTAGSDQRKPGRELPLAMSPQRLLDLDEVIDTSRVTRFQLLIFVLCAVVAMLDGFDTQAIAFVAPAIAADWRIDAAAFGPMFGAGLLGGLIGALVLGRAGDRFGRKPVLLVAILLFAIGSLVTPWVQSIQQMVVLRLITGLGLGGALPCFISITSEYAPKRLRTTLVAAMFCGFPLGAVIGGVVSARLIPAFGWEGVFIVGGILPLVLLPSLVMSLPESIRYLALRNDHAKIAELLERMECGAVWNGRMGAPLHHASVPVSHLFREGRGLGTALLWGALFCSLLMTYLLINWIPVLAHRAGLSISTAVLAVSMLNLGSIFGCVIFGRLGDRFRVEVVIGAAYAAGAIAIACLGLAGKSGPLLCVVAFLAGALSIGAQLCTVALVAAYYETSLRATGIGWSMGVGRIGAMTGPLLGGVLLSAGMASSHLFAIAGLTSLIAAVCVLVVGQKVLARRQTGHVDATAAEPLSPISTKRGIANKTLLGCCLLVLVSGSLFSAGFARASDAKSISHDIHTFYVDSKNGSDSNSGEQSAPWKSLTNIDGRSFAPGDTILFARGSTFSGGFRISSSGNETHPITFATYGSGEAPKFKNPNYEVLNGNAIRIDGSYIIIDGLYIADGAVAPPPSPAERESVSHKAGAIFISSSATHNIVRNNEITRTPFPIHVYGQHNLITHNYIHDLMDLPDYAWWGVGIMISNSNNVVSYNKLVNCRQRAAYLGSFAQVDGGAIELDDRDYPKDNITITHNYSVDNQGFLEIVEGSASVKNLVVAFNFSNDYQQFARISTTELENAKFENNTIILTRQSVFKPAVFDFSWFTAAGGPGLACGTRNPSEILTYRNNIIYLGFLFTVSPYCDFPHDHNIYYRPHDRVNRGWAILGANASLGEGDRIADPQFVNMTTGDFHLKSSSPAVRAGISLGYESDIDGEPMPKSSPNIGAYQKSDANALPAS